MANWKEKMNAVYYRAIVDKSQSITNLYLKLEQIANKHRHEMPLNSEFTIEIGLLTAIKIKFKNPFNEVYVQNKKNNKWELRLKVKDSANLEYNNILYFYDDLLTNNNWFIGEQFPDDLQTCLLNIKAGELLNFSNGNTYVCTKKDRNIPYLKKIKDKDDKFSFKNFKNAKEFPISIDQNFLQDFYIKNKAMSGNLDLGKISIECFGQEYINNIYSNLKPNSTKTIQFGPQKIHVSHSLVGKKLNWFDDNGNKISEEQIKVLFGYYSTKGIEREYIRDNPTDIDKYRDFLCERKIEILINAGRFDLVYEELEKYVKDNNESLSISSKGYIEENGDFVATGFTFICKNNEIKLYKVSYKNNDIDSLQKIDREASQSEFIAFYEALYKNHILLLQNNNKQALEKEHAPQTHTIDKNQKAVAKNLANNNISYEDGIEKPIVISAREEIKISKTDFDIEALIDSYEDNKDTNDIEL